MFFIKTKCSIKQIKTSLIAAFTLSTFHAYGEFPNQNYSAELLNKPTHSGYLKDGPGTGFQNQSHAHGGYVVVAGNGTHMFVDISDPFNPDVVQVVTSPYRTEDIANQHDQEQEGHTVSFAKYPDSNEYMVTIGGKGIDIWDVTDIAAGVSHVTSQDLPGINYGDVDGAIWGLAWQGNTIYVGATNNGLYIVDATDPSNPIDAVSPETPNDFESIANSNWNNIKVGPVFPIGNMLAFGTPKNSGGLVNLDISQAGRPITLDTASCGNTSYMTWFYGRWMFCEQDIAIFDVVGNPNNIRHLLTAGGPASEYMSFADDHLFLGGLRPNGGVYKYDISNINNPIQRGKITHPETDPLEDDQFSVPIGNLIFIADDEHDRGSFLAVHDTQADTTPPRVIYANPVDGADNMPLSTRIGISFSDQIDLRSVDRNSFILREVRNGEEVNGYYGINHTLVHFAPVSPLKPSTEYELLLIQGGVSDLVGNGLDQQYSFRFTTTDNSQPIEAESASLGGGAEIANDHGGFTGAGFVDYPMSGGEVRFHMSEVQAGDYDLIIRFANGSTSTRELRLVVNGEDEGIIRFPTSGAWTSWATQEQRIRLRSGNNTIALVGTQVPGPNLDHIHPRLDPTSQLQCEIQQTLSSEVAENASFQTSAEDDVSYEWQFGDGSASQIGAQVTHRYQAPGRYSVLLNVSNGEQANQCSSTHIVHYPLTEQAPTASSTVIIDESNQLVWNVNPDNNSVSALSRNTHQQVFEITVGEDPRSLAQAADGMVWVSNFDSSDISIIDPRSGSIIDTISLPYASQPAAIVMTPDGDRAFVSLQALGRVIAFDTNTREITELVEFKTGTSHLIPKVRGLAVSADGETLLVTRFVSENQQGLLYQLNTSPLELVHTFELAVDPGNDGPEPDDTFNARGIPNYLNSVRISPDGLQAWVSAKKDNIQRGLVSDGRTPSFDSTTRTIVAPVDLELGVEQLEQRIDLNDSDLAFASVFSPLGDLLFIAVQGNNEVQVYNSHSGQLHTTIPVGRAPQGLVLSGNERLYVHNFLSRSVSVIDVSGLLDGTSISTPTLAEVETVTNETLSAQVLLGKQIFYNAASRNMSRDDYLSCASCHLDGSEDGQVFDFTHRGEGLRNTITLRGRRGTGHGPVHWTGNFNEIQDFENDIRAHFGGLGFMSDNDFSNDSPLSDVKTGLSAELDALTAYVESLNAVPPSPYRQDGKLTPEAQAGEAIYQQLNCVTCHAGNDFTDSAVDVLHDVGTLKDNSGMRLGGALTGLDTPSLKGIWNTAPYLHDGSAQSLFEVINNPQHGDAFLLSTFEQEQLVSYLLQLDEDSENVPGFGDNDGDGVLDKDDLCPNTPSGALVDESGCTIATVFPLQAEDYHRFSDNTAGNEGGDYRNDDVDIQVTSDTGGGFNVGWISAGEWLEYDITLPSGTYEVVVRTASEQSGRMRVSLGDNSISGNVPASGGWQSWQDLSLGEITISQTSVLRIDMLDGPFNLNWIDLRLLCSGEPECTDTDGDGITDDLDLCPNTPAGVQVDGNGCILETEMPVQAEDFDRSFDTSPGNNGNGNTSGDVDTQTTSDTGGGLNVGWISAGEWLEYDLNLAPGTYRVIARVASEQSGRVRVNIGGDSVEANVPTTGGWQTWRDLEMGELTINDGSELRLDMIQGPFNLNWVDLEFVEQ